MIFLINIIALLFAVFSGLHEGYRLLERTTVYGSYESDNYSVLWHLYKLLRDMSGIALGMTIMHAYKDLLPIIITLSISAIIYWNIHDGILNVVNNQSWFHQGKDLNFFERFNTKTSKIITLIVGVLLVYINQFVLK